MKAKQLMIVALAACQFSLIPDKAQAFYNPQVGHWLNRDSIDEFGGYSLNGFVDNDAINNADTLGLYLAAFDGTGNDKDYDVWGSKENAPSNVSIMYSLYQGQKSYQWGVGTRTDIVAGNLFGKGTRDRVDNMLAAIKQFHSTNCEPIDIIGFSRGAASARIFSNVLKSEIPDAKIRFVGLFDTVAQEGLPNSFGYQYGYNLNVDANSVGYIAQAVAADEHRKLFPLTSISSVYKTTFLGVGKKYKPDQIIEIFGQNYWEKPFAGSHSDIGGGYQNSRNKEALLWMIQRGQAAGAPFANLSEYPDNGKINPLINPHDSRYPFIDRVPFTRVGRTSRTIFPGNNQ